MDHKIVVREDGYGKRNADGAYTWGAIPISVTRMAALKSKLALRYPGDIGGYCNSKDNFVKRVERDALQRSGKR